MNPVPTSPLADDLATVPLGAGGKNKTKICMYRCDIESPNVIGAAYQRAATHVNVFPHPV